MKNNENLSPENEASDESASATGEFAPWDE